MAATRAVRSVSSGYRLVALFSFTLLMSSALVFFVEPMFAKMVLPRLGGSPAVWNTCVVFFQAALLAGYVYPHVLTTRLNLEPFLSALAADQGLEVLVQADRVGADADRISSDWLLMARTRGAFGALAHDTRWSRPSNSEARVWTDGFSDILGALK